MTRTITQLHPMVFSLLAEHRKRAEANRRKLVHAVSWTLPVIYVAGALKIGWDTGLLPSDVQFWLILLPFIALGERLFHVFARWGMSRKHVV
jgi:hypothetical protein